MLSKIKSTPLCYTRELIDSLVELYKLYVQCAVDTDEEKLYTKMRSILYDINTKCPEHKDDFAQTMKHVDSVCDRIHKEKNTFKDMYDAKVSDICKILLKQLKGKFVATSFNWISNLVYVNNVKLGGYCGTTVEAEGIYIDLNQMTLPSTAKSNSYPVWQYCGTIGDVAKRVSQEIESGHIPVSGEHSDISMLTIVEPDDVIAWLNERQRIINSTYLDQVNMIMAAQLGHSTTEV